MKTIRYDERGGRTLEDSYSGWLKIFQEVAEAPNGTIEVPNVPRTSWEKLLRYLGEGHGRSAHRDSVEAWCASEPVLVDALWRADMRWGGERRHIWEEEFQISTYSGFWRPEVKKYLDRLRDYTPQKRRCVIVPCAADKPYPSPLHKVVKEAVGDEYEIIVATSVLGLVPEGLWSTMPRYDSGLPYFERVRDEVANYFALRDYSKVINYTDMLQEDVHYGLMLAGESTITPIEFPVRCDYQTERLMSAEGLRTLKGFAR